MGALGGFFFILSSLVGSGLDSPSRKAAWRPRPNWPRGYLRMYTEHIRQAHEGCDFDFLEGAERLPEPEIH